MSSPMYDLPIHLGMPVNEAGQGPVPNHQATAVVCWCGQEGCQLWQLDEDEDSEMRTLYRELQEDQILREAHKQRRDASIIAGILIGLAVLIGLALSVMFP